MDDSPRLSGEDVHAKQESSELVCPNCPTNCHLIVTKTASGQIEVIGADCSHGLEYAGAEVGVGVEDVLPLRILEGVMRVSGGDCEQVSVKSTSAMEWDAMVALSHAASDIELQAPVEIGQTVVKMFGDIELVATSEVHKV